MLLGFNKNGKWYIIIVSESLLYIVFSLELFCVVASFVLLQICVVARYTAWTTTHMKYVADRATGAKPTKTLVTTTNTTTVSIHTSDRSSMDRNVVTIGRVPVRGGNHVRIGENDQCEL